MHIVDGPSLRSGFLASAAARPNDVALVVENNSRTFAELERAARQWARVIVERTPRRVERVGVFAYRSEVAYTGTLAALFSGAAFVPLNRTFPVARTRAMIRRGMLDAIIVDRVSARQLAEVFEGLENPPLVLFPDETTDVPEIVNAVTAEAIAAAVPLDELPAVLVDDIAYLLFTSGTTGDPKGVGVSHTNVMHFLDTMGRRYGLGPDDRVSQTFDQTFDLSVFDIFLAWQAGARLCVPAAIELLAPARFIQKHGLTLWFSVPSIPALMRRKGTLRADTMPTLRWSLFCGEPLPRKAAEEWQAAAPRSVVENLYGPTELTIACTVYRWDPARSPGECVHELVPIGQPLDGLASILVDDALKEVEEGQPGELLVCGPQTVPGYWQDAARTAERFVELPVSPATTKRFYRTGDRVAPMASGGYAYLGRTDFQIKVLGYRVELGEIEAALARQSGVIDAVAVGWPQEEGRATGIVAFVTGDVGDVDAIVSDLRTRLPEYMVPSEVLVHESFALNSNGKIDRNALTAWLRARTEPA